MIARAAAVAVLALAAAAPTAAAADCPWVGQAATPDARAREVVARMTLDDKIAMVHEPAGYSYPYGAAGWIPANPRLCLPELKMNNAGAGVGDLQTQTTAFPAPIAQAASWDDGLQRQVGAAIGAEAWGKGDDVLLGPGIEIDRTPLNGRNFEYFSEDPLLAGRAAAAEVAGIQSESVIATVKHYLANSQETNRNTVSSDVDERTLEELYGRPYAAAGAGAGAVMCSYNRINGVYSCENPDTLSALLKGQYRFAGFVMSDWAATHSTVAAAKAGLDMEMNNVPGTYFGSALKTAVQDGKVPLARLDDMVRRILRSMFAVGVVDHPPAAQPGAVGADVSTPAHRALAATAAERGAVLLKNAGAVLPLAGGGRTIAVIGDAAGPLGAEYTYGGGGSGHVPIAGYDPVKSPLEAIAERARAAGDTALYDEGATPQGAAAAASRADVAIVFANDGETEGQDRPDLDLHAGSCHVECAQDPPQDVNAMIAAVARANPHTVVVLETGGPVVMPWVDAVGAVLEAWYPGVEEGDAIAALLFGDADPGGRLPETFPRSAADLPTATPDRYPGVTGADGVPHASYGEGLLVGYRWYDERDIEPLFEFGFGLSYTTFRLSDLSVRRGAGGWPVASVRVTDTGSRAGTAVPEAYLALPVAGEPPRRLVGYHSVALGPGRSATVSFTLGPSAFATWDPARHAWSRPAGCATLLIGSSSRDLPLRATVAAGGAASHRIAPCRSRSGTSRGT